MQNLGSMDMNCVINCENGATCNIYCSENACNGLIINIIDSTYDLDCYGSGNDDCASLYGIPTAQPTPEPTIITNEPTTLAPTVEPTVTSDICDEVEECKGLTLTAANIVCSATDACENAFMNGETITCSVTNACYSADGINGTDLYLTGAVNV